MGIFDELGPALRRLRVERGLTRKRLAKAAGFTVAQIVDYEAGERTPTLPTLARHLEALGAGLGELTDQLCLGRQGVSRQASREAPEAGAAETRAKTPDERGGEEEILWRLERVAARILRAALDRREWKEAATEERERAQGEQEPDANASGECP